MAWIDEHLGEERTMTNGQRAKIIGGSTSKDLTVQFGDGTVVKGKEYHKFKKGYIANPNCEWISRHLNEERTMKNGQRAKIIGGRGRDLEVEFEDGTIVTGKDYYKFKSGAIANPNYSWLDKHLGEERTMNTGKRAKIVGGEYKNLTIQFEDGTVVKNKDYSNFIKGSIDGKLWIDEHMREEQTMNNGMHAIIVGGRSADLTVKFEDGIEVHHKEYSNFIRGVVAHPTLKLLGTHTLKGSYLGSFDIK